MLMRLVLVIFGLLTAFIAGAQENKNPAFLGVKPQYGFIIPHSNKIRDLTHTNPFGLELEYGWTMQREENWRRCNCYSKAGFSLLHINYNNPEIIGSSSTIIAFAEPMLDFTGNFRTSLRMGVGMSYLSKFYDKITNPENLFFSTPLNFLVHLDLNLYYKLSKQHLAMGYFKYNHISNGGIEKPNNGMNFPTFGLGLQYSFKPVEYREIEKTKYTGRTIIPSAEIYGTVVNTSKINKTDSKWQIVYGAVLKTRFRVGKINALNIGFDALFDKTKQEKGYSLFQGSFLAGHDFEFGKFIFSQYWGTYLYAPSAEKNFYQRYSLLMKVSENFRFGVTLKAHAEVAENFNLLFSYEF